MGLGLGLGTLMRGSGVSWGMDFKFLVPIISGIKGGGWACFFLGLDPFFLAFEDISWKIIKIKNYSGDAV